jgi:hypothetical protein
MLPDMPVVEIKPHWRITNILPATPISNHE